MHPIFHLLAGFVDNFSVGVTKGFYLAILEKKAV